MSTIAQSNTTISITARETAQSLQRLYFVRVAFSVTWIILLLTLAKTNTALAYALFIIYPLWDVVATILDIRANPPHAVKTFQYINIVIGLVTATCVALALQKGVPQAMMVFGGWAFITGLIQLVLGLRRRKEFGGQWPMIISGAQSMLAGCSFVILASSPSHGITSLAGYSAFGAFYFLLSAIMLSKTIKASGRSAG
jgi:uncharacterized membrane protein HdeD (DUF308 family)